MISDFSFGRLVFVHTFRSLGVDGGGRGSALLWQVELVDLIAEAVNLTGEHQEVQSIVGGVFALDVLQSFVQLRVALRSWDSLLQLGVCFLGLIELVVEVVAELLGCLGRLEGVSLQVRWLGQSEEVGVEGWHAWLDVIEKVGLLHVASLNLDWDLFEESLEWRGGLTFVLLRVAENSHFHGLASLHA